MHMTVVRSNESHILKNLFAIKIINEQFIWDGNLESIAINFQFYW